MTKVRADWTAATIVVDDHYHICGVCFRVCRTIRYAGSAYPLPLLHNFNPPDVRKVLRILVDFGFLLLAAWIIAPNKEAGFIPEALAGAGI